MSRSQETAMPKTDKMIVEENAITDKTDMASLSFVKVAGLSDSEV